MKMLKKFLVNLSSTITYSALAQLLQGKTIPQITSKLRLINQHCVLRLMMLSHAQIISIRNYKYLLHY